MTVLIMVRSVNEEGQGNANDEDVEEVVECDGFLSFVFFFCIVHLTMTLNRQTNTCTLSIFIY